MVFDEAYSQDTNTNPSHGSMLTGLYPHVHGNRKNGNPYLSWAFSEAATFALRFQPSARRFYDLSDAGRDVVQRELQSMQEIVSFAKKKALFSIEG